MTKVNSTEKKNKKNDKEDASKVLRVLQLLPLILIVFVIYQNLTSKVVIFPISKDYKVTSQSDTISSAYTDSSEIADSLGSTTTITDFIKNDTVTAIEFSLGTKIKYPYAGIVFHTYSDTTDSIATNLSHMDYLEFDLIARGGKKEVNVYFSEFLEGYTTFDKEMSWRTFGYQVHASEELEHYHIPLSYFKTDAWWWEKQEVSQKDIPKSSLKQIVNLIFENGDYEVKGQDITFTIKNIRFVKDLKRTNISIILIISLYYLILFIVSKFGLNKAIGPIVIPYKQLDVTSYVDDDTKKIEEYIAVNYIDPELTVKKLCHETGITQAKTQVILKKQFQLTFRQYLNRIKISEAKRLLLETDRQVTDIAYKVGYKNVTHFNRIFKEMEGISPNQYRKLNK